MSALEVLQLASSLGVLTGGVGILKWALTVERRLMRLELKTDTEEA